MSPGPTAPSAPPVPGAGVGATGRIRPLLGSGTGCGVSRGHLQTPGDGHKCPQCLGSAGTQAYLLHPRISHLGGAGGAEALLQPRNMGWDP